MIRINRSDRPRVLQRKEGEWTAEYIWARANGELSDTTRYRYRDPTIKKTLRADSYDKCVYCESKVSQASPGQTDHIVPVSRRPDLVVTWENLAYTCEECNRRKGEYYDEDYPLVNPYEEEPDEFLVFYGPVVFQRLNNERGRVTRSVLDLTRAALFERRVEKIQYVHEVIEKYDKATEGPVKYVMREEIQRLMADDAEYAAATRAFVSGVLGEELDQASPEEE